jgi:hypothetical protein
MYYKVFQMSKETVSISLRIPKDICRDIARNMRRTGLTRTALIVSTVRLHLDSVACSLTGEKKNKS